MNTLRADDSSTALTNSDAYIMKRHAGRLLSSAVERLHGATADSRGEDPWGGLTARISAEAVSGQPGRYDGADVQLVENEVLRLKRFAAERAGAVDSPEQSRAEGRILREHARDLVAVADRLRPRVPRAAIPGARTP